MKELEVKAKQNWVLKAKAAKAGSEFDRFEKRELRGLKEREASELRAREALEARDALACELAELELQEKAALSGLNMSVCQKNLILNEVVDLMNRKVDKDELLLLREALAEPSGGSDANPPRKDSPGRTGARNRLQSPARRQQASKPADRRETSSRAALESPHKGQPTARRLASSSSSVTRSLKVLQPSRILEQIERQRSAAQILPKKQKQSTPIPAVPEEERGQDLETPQKPRPADSRSRLPKAGSAAANLQAEKPPGPRETHLRDLKSLSEFEATETPTKAPGKNREKSLSSTPRQTPRGPKGPFFSPMKPSASLKQSTADPGPLQASPRSSKFATPTNVKLLWNPEPRKPVLDSVARAEPALRQAGGRVAGEPLQQAGDSERLAGFSGCKNFDFEFITEE